MNNKIMPFHLAVPVKEIVETRFFYREIMGFTEGRSSDTWVDFDFYGHQFVIHVKPEFFKANPQTHSNAVDGHEVPVPHFGVVLNWEDWETLATRLRAYNIKFAIEPYIRFKGQIGEQATMFFYDPSGNALEFKAFKDLSLLFEK
jgi:extradiol dioxygenase family protein